MDNSAEFPKPIFLKSRRRYFLRHQLENYKRALAGMALIDESTVSVIEYVSAHQVALELGQSPSGSHVPEVDRLATARGQDLSIGGECHPGSRKAFQIHIEYLFG